MTFVKHYRDEAGRQNVCGNGAVVLKVRAQKPTSKFAC